MELYFISERTIHAVRDGADCPLSCERYEKYLETVRSIQNATAWKNSGAGAMFTGSFEEQRPAEAIPVKFSGLAMANGELLFALRLDDMGGLYAKGLDETGAERHLHARRDLYLGGISAKNGRLAISAGSNPQLRHLSVVQLSDDSWQELTDGDTVEDSPFWSRTKNTIYCSTAGYARGKFGEVAATGPQAIAEIDPDAGTFTERYADPAMDYLKPSDDKAGNFYYIRQPYRVGESTGLWEDIVMFPVRIVRAIGGLLNWFSIRFGGESLRGGNLRHGNERARQKSQEELFFEGNHIRAAQNQKDSERRGEKHPSILPASRVLVRVAPDGTETVLRKGVLDYVVADTGEIYCSNGQYVLKLSPDGSKAEAVCKAKFAVRLTLRP